MDSKKIKEKEKEIAEVRVMVRVGILSLNSLAAFINNH